MAREPGGANAQNSAAHDADKSGLIDEKNIENLDAERKDAYLKRIKKENQKGKKAFAKGEEWIEIEGRKVLIKFTNAVGSIYSRYFFNAKRYPAEHHKLVTQGFYIMVDPHNGEELKKLELKLVNGRPWKAEKKKK